MALQKVYLSSYTDNDIVSKINSATSAITRADCVSATARPIANLEITNARLASNAVTNVKVSASAAISADKTADGTTRKAYTATERTKLAGIEDNAARIGIWG